MEDSDTSLKERLYKDGNHNEVAREFHKLYGMREGYPMCCIDYFTEAVYNGDLLIRRMKRGCLTYLGSGPIPNSDKDLYIWSPVFNRYIKNGDLFNISDCPCNPGYIKCDKCHSVSHLNPKNEDSECYIL